MKKFPKSFGLLIILSFLILSACVKTEFDDPTAQLPDSDTIENDSSEEPGDDETEVPVEEADITDIPVPLGFEFATQKKVIVTILDVDPSVTYDIYAFNSELTNDSEESYVNDEGIEETSIDFQSDNLNQFLFSGAPRQGILEQLVVVPSYYDKLYLRRKEGFLYTSAVLEIIGENAQYSHSSSTKKSRFNFADDDVLYAVNGSAELFQINPVSGEYTIVSDMPMGSFTAAIDEKNKALYSIGKNKPNPLMRYSLENDTWQTVGNVQIGGPRLDFNPEDGLLYFSKKNKLYSIDPSDGTIISTWKIDGLHNRNGGDIAFSEDGTLFLCSFSGLYKLELNINGSYSSERISAENLPFNPTSMTFDSDGNLWLANNSGSSDLIMMDTVTGGWEYVFGKTASNGTDFERSINDLTTFSLENSNSSPIDSDGDGVTDSEDSFPSDPTKAYEVYSPSKLGWGTLAFEDLYPFIGDYDFNDVALTYRIISIQNENNETVEIEFNIEVISNGASFVNGFGIELENLLPSEVASVEGNELTEGFISTTGNGLEAGQENAVLIFYDNNFLQVGKAMTVTLKLSEPKSTVELGPAPYNPFVIVNANREVEVHLPNKGFTSLGNADFEVVNTDADADRDFISDSGLPWGINIIHPFKVPTEKTPINEAYNFFNQWVASDGMSFADWYKDNPGYREASKIQE